MQEEWRDIEDYEGLYQVSDMGRVRSLDRTILTSNDRVKKLKGKPLTPSLDSHGYMRVMLSINGCPKTHRVHRLMAKEFIPNPDNKHDVNHIDHNRANNALSNLEWTTRKENIRHGADAGRFGRVKGADIHTSKLTENKVRAIHSLLSLGVLQKDIAKHFGVAAQTISGIKLGNYWHHIWLEWNPEEVAA